MATQAERLEALEKDNGILSAALEALTSTVSSTADRLADVERILKDGEPITAELLEGPDLRGDLLKAFRQIETIAGHINVKLPA